ncbi:MAG: cyclic nucleotide-binding domain-containing protein [Cyanobacteriota bacterium]
MVALNIYIFTLILTISIVVLTPTLLAMVKTRTAKGVQISLFLIDLFLIIRLILQFLTEDQTKLYTVLHTISLLLISLATIKIFSNLIVKYVIEKFQLFEVPEILQTTAEILIFIISGFIILNTTLKLESSILVTSGILTLTIGLALKDTLGNLVSGLAIEYHKAITKGDWVLINKKGGNIENINWMTTNVLTYDNDDFIIPNSIFSKYSFINHSRPTAIHMMIIKIRVSYEIPPNLVKDTIMEVIRQQEFVLQEYDNSVILTRFNDFNIDYEIRVHIPDLIKFIPVKDGINSKLWYQFKRKKIPVSMPIRTTFIKKHVKEKDILSVEYKKKLLKTVDFLKPLKDQQIENLAKRVKLETFAADEMIIRQGEIGDNMYILEEGYAELLYEDINGDIRSINTVSSPSIFGELSSLSGSPRTVTVLALTDCKLFSLDKNTFSDLFNADPAIGQIISEIITSRKIQLDQISKTPKKIDTIPEREDIIKDFLSKMKTFFRF